MSEAMPLTEISAAPEPLSPLYYLSNFDHLVEVVSTQYLDILGREEQHYLQSLAQLSDPARALLVRMYSRRGILFRSDRLVYPELPAIGSLLSELEQRELIRTNPELYTEDALSLLTVTEMRHWWADLCPKQGRRAELIEFLADEVGDSYYDTVPFDTIMLQHQDTVDLLLMLFFGNNIQDLSAFVTAELGHVRYESYRLDRSARLLNTPVEVEQARVLLHLRERYYQQEEINAEVCQSILTDLPSISAESPLADRYSRLCNRIGRALERLQCWDEALDAYARSHRPPARERTARILFRQEYFSRAKDLCDHILQQPANESELLFARRFVRQCAKKLGEVVAPERRFRPSLLEVTLPASPARVEALACAALQDQGDCLYVENWLFNAVFGLTFWEALFAPVPGAFSHPFQRAPHDIYDAGFQPRRKSLIEAGFQQLARPDWRLRLQQRWQEKSGISNSFVGWFEEGWGLIERAVTIIPTEHWRAIFRRMLSDLAENCSGFPDLIQFTDDGHYRLIEVKSPNDKIQPNQSRWMEMFAREGIPCFLLQVHWQEQPVTDLAGH